MTQQCRPQRNAAFFVTACPSETETSSPAHVKKRPGSPLHDKQAKKLRLEEVKHLEMSTDKSSM